MSTTQLDGSVGAAIESVFGTAVTVTKFVEYLSDSTLEWNPEFAHGKGLVVGSRVLLAGLRPATPVKQLTNIGLNVEACSKGIGWMFKSAFSAPTSTQRGATGVYQHNYTLATADTLSSYTIQNGVPPVGGGATLPHTYPGCVCASMDIEIPNGDIAMVKANFVGREMKTDVVYAAPSYPDPVEILTFAGASITIGGSPTAPTTTALATGGTAVTNVIDFKLTVDNNLDDGGYTLGGGGKRGRVPAIGRTTISGTITAEFTAATLRDYYLDQTHVPIVATVLGNDVIGTGSDVPALSLYLPDVVFEGEMPPPTASGVYTQTIPFTVLDNGTDEPITLSWVSTDATV